MYYLVCFDISCDRVRYRVVKLLKGYGARVQKSVFECPQITEKQLLEMMEKMDALIDHATDTIRLYRLCAACRRELELVGPGAELTGEKFFSV